MQEALKEKRKTNPDFFYAADGVHMDAAGHKVLAEAILKAWGVSDWVAASTELRTLIKQKEATVHDAWLSKVGHKRPGVKAGLPLSEANERVAALEKEIQALLDSSLSPQSE